MATAIPFTDDESNGVLLDTLEKAQQKAGARRVVAKPSMPRMVGGSGAASQADINELTRAIQGLTETMGGKTDNENLTDVQFVSFPSTTGTQQFSLPNEGGSSEVVFDFEEGTVSQDGIKSFDFPKLGVARFIQITTDSACDLAINNRSAGIIDFKVAASPLTLTGVTVKKLFLIFRSSTINTSFIANDSVTGMEISKELPVKFSGSIVPIYGTLKEKNNVTEGTTNRITLDSSANNLAFDPNYNNNTITYEWGENQRLSAYYFSALEGSTPEKLHGVSETLGFQYRSSQGNLSSSLDNGWATGVFKTSVTNCNDFAWVPNSPLSFESTSNVRFNITAQNYHTYKNSTAQILPTLVVEEF